jgi:hypothetical protein
VHTSITTAHAQSNAPIRPSVFPVSRNTGGSSL